MFERGIADMILDVFDAWNCGLDMDVLERDICDPLNCLFVANEWK